jgi:hypothetical protein
MDDDDLLEHAMRQVGLSKRVFRGNPVGVFLGAVDRPSIEAIESGTARTHRPELSWDMVVQHFRSGFDAVVDLSVRPDLAARADAIRNRRERAKRVRYGDILLSARLKGDLSRAERGPADVPDEMQLADE